MPLKSRQNQDIIRAYFEANRRVQAAAPREGQLLPIAILNTFLGAAMWGPEAKEGGDPVIMEELADRLGISPTTLSAHLRYLGPVHRGKVEGWDLVETHENIMNRRQKTFRLTNKGRALAEQLIFLLSGLKGHGEHHEETQQVPAQGQQGRARQDHKVL